jgi:hypothetical protein
MARSRAQAVIAHMLAGLDGLEQCEHLADRIRVRYCLALQPGRLVCQFCWARHKGWPTQRTCAASPVACRSPTRTAPTPQCSPNRSQTS